MTGFGLRQQVLLFDVPVTLWLTSNQWLEEVLREVSLAGLSGNPEAGRLGRSMSALIVRHAVALGGDGDTGTAALWAAHERGLDRIDIGYDVSQDITVTAALVRTAVDDLERRCLEGLLLTLPPRPEEQRLMQWISAQLVGQRAGEPPHAWPGPWVSTP